MKRYIAFLRGINISGKNKVSMAELKQGFERLDYTDVGSNLRKAIEYVFDTNRAE